ncbi:MAG: isoprenyl transferase [Elusimicrobiales bacterium]
MKDKLPRHIAIIMDGNGRWASARGLPRAAGHKAGADAVENIVLECSNLGIRQLTLYAFSAENWSRPRLEVAALMRLLVLFLDAKARLFEENNVRLAAIGRLDMLPDSTREKLEGYIARFAKNSGMTLCLALSYGSRQEILDAANAAVRAGKTVDEETFSRLLYTAAMPDPDMIIRTSGEMRLSNFLLWQASYAELYFTPVHWPDFDAAELRKALDEYARRERRFGGH